MQVTLSDSLISALEILNFVMAVDCYPNILVAYRILLTVPVTVAPAYKSFSKLKLLNNYLRSTMSQERLNGFAMCNIEKSILDTIDLNTILMILHQEMPEEVSFCEPMDIMELSGINTLYVLRIRVKG